MGIAPAFAVESAEVKTIPTAGVENRIAGSRVDGLRDRHALMPGKPPVM